MSTHHRRRFCNLMAVCKHQNNPSPRTVKKNYNFNSLLNNQENVSRTYYFCLSHRIYENKQTIGILRFFLSFFFVPPNKNHAADGDKYAQLRGHRCPPMATFIVSPLSFSIPLLSCDVQLHSAQPPHQRSCCTSPQPASVFDILFFKLRQERGHLKTWACVWLSLCSHITDTVIHSDEEKWIWV